MKYLLLSLLLLISLAAGCDRPKRTSTDSSNSSDSSSDTPAVVATPPVAQPAARPQPPVTPSLAEERKKFTTHLIKQIKSGDPVEPPPAGVFDLVRYDAAAGKLAAHLTPDPHDGKRHPAMIWITGGDCNSIGAVWEPADRSNDQTAAAYRKAGIVMMFPSLRGGNDNPGVQEGFLGEVDDVLSAADFLAKQPYVDPQRIYLGGHSTGGTLILLVAECSNRFRNIFCFGPVASPTMYGSSRDYPFDKNNKQEVTLRSPGEWLPSIQTTTFVFEGTESPSNISSLALMTLRRPTSRFVHFLPATGASHFSILAPANELIARKIVADTGPQSNIVLTEDDVADLKSAQRPARGR